MSNNDQPNDTSPQEAPVPDDCPLSRRQQIRNLTLFVSNKSLIYLVGPVLYVGNLDAVLLKQLEYSGKLANLPATAYVWTTAPFIVLFAWYFCQVGLLKRMTSGAYAVIAATGAVMVAVMLRPTPPLVLSFLVLRATLLGWCLAVIAFYEWEILARGVSKRRRGLALGLAFGLGPAFAVLGSLVTQLVLDGKLGPLVIPEIAYPWNFAILFASVLPIMGLAALLATHYTLPPVRTEVVREPLVSGVFGGMGEFLTSRLLVTVSLVYMLVLAGSDFVLPNVTLYTKQALGEAPEHYVGYQFALRFGCKIVAGLLIGWLLARTNAKAGLLTTMLLCVAGISWVLLVSGTWYLMAFGILGAGELCCVYYQNYIVSCSAKSKVRRNLAYSSLLMMPVVLMPVVYGAISDAFGFHRGFQVAWTLLILALVIAVLVLPARPKPPEAGSPSKAN